MPKSICRSYQAPCVHKNLPRFRKNSHPRVPPLCSLHFGVYAPPTCPPVWAAAGPVCNWCSSSLGSWVSWESQRFLFPKLPSLVLEWLQGSCLSKSPFQGSGVPMGPPCPCSQYLQAARVHRSLGPHFRVPGVPSCLDTSPQAAKCPPAWVSPLSALPTPTPSGTSWSDLHVALGRKCRA